MHTHYYTIAQQACIEYTDRGSRFIAYAIPLPAVSSFKALLAHIKQEHPKASHYCFAYRISSQVYRTSDAGEPSGTAGRPILAQLDAKQLSHVLIVVVRYFGGTLLGIPGLINAYRTAASLALQTVPILQKEHATTITIQCNYTVLNQVYKTIEQVRGCITQQQQGLFAQLTIALPSTNIVQCTQSLQRISGVVVTS